MRTEIPTGWISKEQEIGEYGRWLLDVCSDVLPVGRVRLQGKDPLEEAAGNSSSLSVSEDLWCLPL